jgi:nicotinate-nucleotide adenylyltransferase
VDNPLRIGVFGGTFDPIHRGHLAIAQAARDQAGLDKVLFVIAAHPPHKRDAGITPVELRVAMTEAAIAGEKGFEVCRIEVDRSGPSYTSETLQRLRRQHPEAELFFIVGYDSALDLPKWRNPEEILRHATLLVAPRPDNSLALPSMLQGRFRMLAMSEYNIASSDIRARLQRNGSMKEFLPEAVIALSREKGLYHVGFPNAAG